jgi:hypothetical protein
MYAYYCRGGGRDLFFLKKGVRSDGACARAEAADGGCAFARGCLVGFHLHPAAPRGFVGRSAGKYKY